MPPLEVGDITNLLGTSDGDLTHGVVTILAYENVGFSPITTPPGEPEVQTISVYDVELTASDGFLNDPEFKLYLGLEGSGSGCIKWDASDDDVKTAIMVAAQSSVDNGDSNNYGVGVVVARSDPPIDEIWGLPSSPAPNGYTWTITYAGYNGDVPDPYDNDAGGLYFETSGCAADFTGWQKVDAQTLVDGEPSTVSCDTEGCVNGVVRREQLTDFSVPEDSCTTAFNAVEWNAAEIDIKNAIEACNTDRQVEVSRSVIDQYGTMEWEVTFTKNPGTTPTGAGDVSLLSVAQGSADTPDVDETQKGSTGLSGTFTLDYNDPGGSREVRFDEDVDRMRRKLEEMSTISDVFVEREEYPAADGGGWGGIAVDDGTPGGYVWKVRFLTVPGAYNGKTFPAGTGNVDAIVPFASSLSGTSATVVTTTFTEGADEMSGGFVLSFADEATEPLLYTADETAVEAVLEDLSNIGDVSVSFDPYTATRIGDATVNVGRDATFAEVSSSSSSSSTDLRTFLSPGVVFRIGGDDASAAGTLEGTNGEGLLDYPGGVGHRLVHFIPSRRVTSCSMLIRRAWYL